MNWDEHFANLDAIFEHYAKMDPKDRLDDARNLIGSVISGMCKERLQKEDDHLCPVEKELNKSLRHLIRALKMMDVGE